MNIRRSPVLMVGGANPTWGWWGPFRPLQALTAHTRCNGHHVRKPAALHYTSRYQQTVRVLSLLWLHDCVLKAISLKESLGHLYVYFLLQAALNEGSHHFAQDFSHSDHTNLQAWRLQGSILLPPCWPEEVSGPERMVLDHFFWDSRKTSGP